MRPPLGAFATALFALAGCLDVPSGPGQECHVNSDCDSGEVCTEGLCYGNPPAGMFAATLSAPSTSEDLVSTELMNLTLPPDGWLGELQLESPVTISGRVEAYCASPGIECDTLSIGAQVRLTRPSQFPGGPALRFSTLSKPDVPRGTDSFTIRVPRTREDGEPWIVTIDPDGGGDAPPTDGGTDPAERVPPRRLTLNATDNLEHQTYTLGGPDAPVITGTLKDAIGQPLLGYRVVALGRWDQHSTSTEVSSVHFTTDGQYAITVADEAIGPLEIVAKPFGPGVIAPELRVSYVMDATHQRNITQPTGLGDRVDLEVPVQALAGDGQVKLVSGARVIVTGVLEPAFSGGARAVLTAETTTGEDGIARLSLLDGPMLQAVYRVRVVPPASSSFGVVFDSKIDLAKPAPLRLPSRIALRGTVVDFDGVPVPAVSVTARRSVRFLWSLTGPNQTFLDEIPASTAITPESGEFVVWVDPAVADVWAHYDLFFETSAGSHAPNWTIPDLEIPRTNGQMTLSLDTVALPDAARLHGKVISPSGNAVDGSSLRLFQLTSNEAVCREVGFEPLSCTPGAVVLGSAESEDDGAVRLNLPRP